MTSTTVEALIDKQDTFEIIRDQIAAILVTNVTAQKAYATAGGEDPDDWDLKVFTERSNPWEQVLNAQETADKIPIVNVWYDNDSCPVARGNVVSRQTCEGTFNIDCYGFGVSTADGAGHSPGDKVATFEAQRAARLVRNILMSANCTYLGLRGTVGFRWIRGREMFQPQIDSRPIAHSTGVRLTLDVHFNETAAQVAGNEIEGIFIDITRQEDGQVYFTGQYPDP